MRFCGVFSAVSGPADLTPPPLLFESLSSAGSHVHPLPGHHPLLLPPTALSLLLRFRFCVPEWVSLPWVSFSIGVPPRSVPGHLPSKAA